MLSRLGDAVFSTPFGADVAPTSSAPSWLRCMVSSMLDDTDDGVFSVAVRPTSAFVPSGLFGVVSVRLADLDDKVIGPMTLPISASVVSCLIDAVCGGLAVADG